MSEQLSHAGIPEWDLADRMRKSLRAADLGVQEIADYLEGTSRYVAVAPDALSAAVNAVA